MRLYLKGVALAALVTVLAALAPRAEAGARIVVGIGLPPLPWIAPAPAVFLPPYPLYGLYGYPRHVRAYGYAGYAPRAYYAAPVIGAHRRWRGW
jgi:hypothetical protein